jgi:hypothetical protein
MNLMNYVRIYKLLIYHCGSAVRRSTIIYNTYVLLFIYVLMYSVFCRIPERLLDKSEIT